ncbi:sensor histidine kinase [Paenibacillus daejeonensis]|uniref:sensor histidine kinase n=1 Tax=Paenibacillus daejeonensis TaxID=135193 RepID=UPI0003676FBE|nr:ATP-binding protein [Paenibacillus daejeonensis]
MLLTSNRYKAILFVFAAVLGVSSFYLYHIIEPQASYFFVYVVGNLLLAAYLFFSNKPKREHVLPIHLALLAFLFFEGPLLLFLGAGLLFTFASVYFTARASFRPSIKKAYYAIALFGLAAAILAYPVMLFGVFTVYMTITVLHLSSISRYHKWSVGIVTLLHMLSILTLSSKVFLPYQENMIFSLPVSFALYVAVLLWEDIQNHLYRCFQASTILFAYVVILLYGYALASYQLNTYGENLFALYNIIGLILGGIVILICLYIRNQLVTRTALLHERLDTWFTEKYEDALADYNTDLSWSGFDSKWAELVPNDGIRICYKEREMFASGYFRQLVMPVGKGIDTGGSVCLTIHETNTHMPYAPAQYYTYYALAGYLGRKLDQWQEIRKLHIAKAEAASDFSKELKFRKEVTYYLHDNVLQNIIAVKNIVTALPTEQTALKELAVETLGGLNTSIRSQMHDIYPSTLKDLSFERNIHILIDDMRERYGYIPTPHIKQGIAGKLDEEAAYLFYRAIQELLTNTCKYGEAENLWISLHEGEDLVLDFRDDGKLIQAEDLEVKIRHLGLSSLKHQAQSLGGTFDMMQDALGKQFLLTLPRRTS